MKKSILCAVFVVLALPITVSAQQGKDQPTSAYFREQAVGLTDPIRSEKQVPFVKEEPAFRTRPETFIKKNIGILKSGEKVSILVEFQRAFFESTSSISYSNIDEITSVIIKDQGTLIITFSGKKPLGNFADVIHVVPTSMEKPSYQITISGDVIETLSTR